MKSVRCRSLRVLSDAVKTSPRSRCLVLRTCLSELFLMIRRVTCYVQTRPDVDEPRRASTCRPQRRWGRQGQVTFGFLGLQRRSSCPRGSPFEWSTPIQVVDVHLSRIEVRMHLKRIQRGSQTQYEFNAEPIPTSYGIGHGRNARICRRPRPTQQMLTTQPSCNSNVNRVVNCHRHLFRAR